jgi:hypothetical protein
MNDAHDSAAGPKAIPGWVCLAIGIGFLAGLAGLIVLVRVLAG